MSPVTHYQLVCGAVRWLQRKRRCGVVVFRPTIMATEQPDSLGWKANGWSTLVECKVSRADFFRDAKKHFRKLPARGVGNCRYYLTPAGLIKRDELPPLWGWLEWSNGRLFEAIKAEHQPEKNVHEEQRILLASVRRGGDCLIPTEAELSRFAS